MQRIWVFASNFNNWAGPNNHLLDLCNHLHVEMGKDISLVTHDIKPNPEFEEQIKFPVLRVLEGNASTPESRLLHTYPNIVKIRKLAYRQGIKPGEVMVNSSIDTLYTAWLAFNNRMATGYNVLSNDPRSILFNAMDRIAASVAVKRILAHSHYQQKIYINLGIDEKRITIIPHCIDMNRIERMSQQPQSDAPEDPIILFVGRLTINKGLIHLLDAYERIRKVSTAKLVIIGKGPLEDYVTERKQAIEKGPGRIEYLGWQPTTVVLGEMRKASIIIVPSLEEPFGIVALEAMCLKKAVVASKVGGLSEIIEDDKNGVLVEPGNAKKLDDVITELMADSRKRSNLGENGYTTVESKYSVNKIAPRFLEFMEINNG